MNASRTSRFSKETITDKVPRHFYTRDGVYVLCPLNGRLWNDGRPRRRSLLYGYFPENNKKPSQRKNFFYNVFDLSKIFLVFRLKKYGEETWVTSSSSEMNCHSSYSLIVKSHTDWVLWQFIKYIHFYWQQSKWTIRLWTVGVVVESRDNLHQIYTP